jgi:hypothetical protein
MVISKSKLEMKRVKAAPIPNSDEGRYNPLPDYQSQYAPARSAKSHANTDLPRSLGNRIGHHSVDARSCQNQRNRGKDSQNQGIEATRSHGRIDHVFHGSDACHRLILVDCAHSALNKSGELPRIAISASQEIDFRLGDCLYESTSRVWRTTRSSRATSAATPTIVSHGLDDRGAQASSAFQAGPLAAKNARARLWIDHGNAGASGHPL